MTETNKGGRPTVMTPRTVDTICERLAEGESLAAICADPDMPAKSTVLLAVVDDRDGFRTSYMRAREAAGFSHADRILAIADRVASGALEPNAGRVVIDGMKWAAERMAPRQHSPRQEVEQSGTLNVNVVAFTDAGNNPGN